MGFGASRFETGRIGWRAEGAYGDSGMFEGVQGLGMSEGYELHRFGGVVKHGRDADI